MIISYVVVTSSSKVDVPELDLQLEVVIQSAWAESTLATRNSQWGKYIRFCRSNRFTPVPADPITIARFLVHLGKSRKFSTCNNYMSAIVTLHKFFGFAGDFREMFLTKMVLKGLARRLGKQVDQKIGLTVDDLQRIHASLDFRDVNVITKWTALMFCFRTLLRKSNVVQNSLKDKGSVIQRADIDFTAEGMLVMVRKTKTIQNNEYVIKIPVSYVNNPCFCVTSMVASHFLRTPNIDGCLFCVQEGGFWKPLLYKDLLNFLKNCVKCIGLSPEEVGLHSLRRSGAAFLQSIDVSLVDIMNARDWKSLAALTYLVSPLSRKQVIEKRVVESLSLKV